MGVIFFTNALLINVSAAGPLDGLIIDGSLLTSDESATDENGVSTINDKGSGMVYISGYTNCYRTSDKVQVFLYLERLSNGGWTTVKTQSNVAYDTYKVSTAMGFAVAKGYYYRVKGTHIAKKGSTTESCTTCTSAIYIN